MSPAAVEAEIAFWNSVKDSGKADELRAYLKKYPNGQFAELARLRIKDAEKMAAPAAPPAASPTPSTALMREVQQRLYSLNFDVTRFDGGLDEGTDRAIKFWQRRAGFAPSGTLTAEQVKALRAEVPSTRWGALAFPTSGNPVTAFGKKSRSEAEAAALAACKERHAVACRAFSVFDDNCLAVASFRAPLPNGQVVVSQHFARDRSAAASVGKALSACTADARRGANPCVMVGAVCAGAAVPPDQLKLAPAPAPPSSIPPPPPKKAKGQDA